MTQGRNQEFRTDRVGWWYEGTLGVILIISSEVDLSGFRKRGQKAVIKKAHIRFPTKSTGVATRQLPSSYTSDD